MEIEDMENLGNLEFNPAWRVITGDCLKVMASMPGDSVDLVFGSPPYPEQGRRYIDGARRLSSQQWVEWMLEVTEAAVRVCRGYVLWVANGAVRRGRYLPACEGLVWEWHKRGGICDRPCIWHKNAPPNRGEDWFGNDWEYVLACKRADCKPYFDWQAVAKPPEYTSGGHFRQRGSNGQRRRGSDYPRNELARPRDVFRVTVGGNHMGSRLASQSEAPFLERLAGPFVKSCCPPGGIVLDPFSGSGTTCKVAVVNGRRAIGIDVRESQTDLATRRLEAEARCVVHA
jgi:site-specific DNA-methyltransferase (adenine-specific)/site-specific DNA-methyltransferase (cytosine-N4-specific)